MKYLLNDEKLTFAFGFFNVTCSNYDYNCSYYQINGILPFAVINLALEIRKQQKRKSIILKKRKPIIHLLNYIDILNFNFNSHKFEITLPLRNDYNRQLTRNLYLYRRSHHRRYYEDYYGDSIKVIESKNLRIIRLEYSFASIIQPKNSSLATVLMHILEKDEIDTIDASGIIYYCVFLM